MIRRDYLVRWPSALIACAVVALAGALAFANEDPTTLSGEIEIAQTDDDGNVKAVAIYDVEWGSVLISNNEKGKELLKHVGELATVNGTIVELDEESDYLYEIRVTSYVIEDSDEPDDQ